MDGHTPTRKERIRIVPAEAVTSARRWKTLGVLRTTLINQLVIDGFILHVSSRRLVSLYRGGTAGKGRFSNVSRGGSRVF